MRDAELLRADEQARIEALDISRSFIVQAPAGSGKTELLIQRYLRLLAAVDEPEEVVAITFTRKAAAEMQFRVLQALRRRLRGTEPAEVHEQITAAAADAVLARDKFRNWRLADNPRRLRIQTLDALNASIARMQPLTAAGAAGGNAVANDAETRDMYRRAAAATLDWLTEPGRLRDAVATVLQHVDNHTGVYVAYLARMLETRDQWLPFIGTGTAEDTRDGRLRTQLEDNLRTVVAAHLDRLSSRFAPDLAAELLPLARFAARNLRESGQDDLPIAALAQLQGLPARSHDALAQWRGLSDLLLTAQGGWRKRVNKNQGFPVDGKEQKQRFVALLDRLAKDEALRLLLQEVRSLPPAGYSDDQWSVLLALFRLLPLAVAELQNLFNANRASDYIEVALAADRAIGTAERPGDIALLLDYQVRHLLVDEMQDTSRAQYRMLEALTGGWEEGDGRTLFCVGDPMQSIYRFRNAEVSQFLLAQRNGIGSVRLESLRLRRNFRSGDFLVHWFNTVFPTVLADEDDPSRGAVSYAEAVPALGTAGDCRVYPLFDGNPEEEARRGLRVIRDTLEQYPDDDMAVLVRSRTQLTALLPRLRDSNIAYRSVEIDRLTDLPEIVDVLALTRALVHPGDRLAWLAVLRSPWIAWRWADLHALVKNDRHSTVRELLNDAERIRKLSDAALRSLEDIRDELQAMLATSRSESLRDRVERAWLRLGGPAILDDAQKIENVYRYLDVLEKLEVAGSLHDVAELEAQLDLERVSSSADARLQVMTMHRAKGLQFDHVLLYGLGRVPRRPDRSVLGWFDLPDVHGGERKVISPVGRRAELENDPIHRFIEIFEADKDRHETGRLLYVACTRARKSLHLLGHTGVSSDGESCRAPDARSLLRLLWPAAGPQFERAFEPGRTGDGPDLGKGWIVPERRVIEPPWRVPVPAAVPGQQQVVDSRAAGQPVEYYWVGLEARIAGTIVHRWLKLAAEGRARLDVDRLDVLRAGNERWLQEAGVGEGSIAAIQERVERALAGVLSDPRGQWLLAGPGSAELALSGMVDNTLQSGVIDRVRIDDDGTHWVVDYKTSTHEGGNLEGFLQAEAERYRDQLARYAALYRAWSGEPVRCALYFPLLREFVEVPA